MKQIKTNKTANSTNNPKPANDLCANRANVSEYL